MLKKSFTLMEILIAITLLGILAAGTMALLKPQEQIYKAWDSKRKKEMDAVRKALEDFYNDKQRYPLATEICYDATTTNPNFRYDSSSLLRQSCSCHVCGTQVIRRSLTPYVNSLLCDPQNPQKKYLYDFDCRSNGVNPSWYRLYTALSNTSDPAIKEVGCKNNCGPKTDLNYNYLVFSSNVYPEVNPYQCLNYFPLYIKTPSCDNCGSYAACLRYMERKGLPLTTPLYIDATTCKIECVTP
ncbi:type II secretion system protein [Candidatus Roizmanbacteria bacterium]|nr:type II secretion system protein [Candidatus Roizmanbacteria bacterium]